MTYKELKHKIKEEQKSLAQKIRTCKPLRKPKNWDSASEKTKQLCNSYNEGWNNYGWEFRHRHIIYCNMFNNTPYDMIEQPRDGNRPSSHLLDKIKEEWENQIDDEVVCDCA